MPNGQTLNHRVVQDRHEETLLHRSAILSIMSELNRTAHQQTVILLGPDSYSALRIGFNIVSVIVRLLLDGHLFEAHFCMLNNRVQKKGQR